MTARSSDKRPKASVATGDFLQAAPVANQAISVIPASDDGALVKIPMKHPKWLIPPISWIVPFSSHRQVRLDVVGLGVFKLCDGKKTVETIIEEFAAANKLSFREAQLPVTQFLQQMTERGIVVIVGSEQKSE
jgi:hypothetical protein